MATEREASNRNQFVCDINICFKYFEWVERCKNSNVTVHNYILEVRGRPSCFFILVKSISRSCSFVTMFLGGGYFIRSPSLSY